MFYESAQGDILSHGHEIQNNQTKLGNSAVACDYERHYNYHFDWRVYNSFSVALNEGLYSVTFLL